MKNYWFIGDIHGEIRLLDSLLQHMKRFNPDHIVFLGDYIDRGPQSREVIQRIMSLDLPVSCLLGNHEMMLLNAIEELGYGNNPIEHWYYNGGEATLQSFGFTSFFSFQSDMSQEYLDFFHNLKMGHVIHLHKHLKVLGTHAGISPAIPIQHQLAMNDYQDLNGYLLKNHIDPGDSFLWTRDGFFNSPATITEQHLVVHGHTPVPKLRRFIISGGQKNFLFVDNDLCIRKDHPSGRIISIDIDSGSFISGRLTGLGFFVEEAQDDYAAVRMRSLTISGEDIFPRDLGLVPR